MEKIFAKGFSVKRRDTAPDFHVCRLSCKVDEAIAFLSEHSKAGYVNINVTKAKSGSFYCELDTYEPKTKDTLDEKANEYFKETAKQTFSSKQDTDLPF